MDPALSAHPKHPFPPFWHPLVQQSCEREGGAGVAQGVMCISERDTIRLGNGSQLETRASIVTSPKIDLAGVMHSARLHHPHHIGAHIPIGIREIDGEEVLIQCLTE